MSSFSVGKNHIISGTETEWGKSYCKTNLKQWSSFQNTNWFATTSKAENPRYPKTWTVHSITSTHRRHIASPFILPRTWPSQRGSLCCLPHNLDWQATIKLKKTHQFMLAVNCLSHHSLGTANICLRLRINRIISQRLLIVWVTRRKQEIFFGLDPVSHI